MLREEKVNFIDKEFNKIRKDVVNCPLPLNINKTRSKDCLILMSKLKFNN
jgi:hypothetical protein